MLILYTERNIPKNKTLVSIPWRKYFDKYRVTGILDDSDNDIVRSVEQTHIINRDTIYGKFSNTPIAIGSLSEGCKTLLCINHAIKTKTSDKFVFNITTCGGNAVSYLADTLAKDADVNAYINHSNFGISTDCNIQINGKVYTDATIAADEYMDLVEE